MSIIMLHGFSIEWGVLMAGTEQSLYELWSQAKRYIPTGLSTDFVDNK